MKFIWIITLALCTNYKSKCNKECEIQPDHTHLIQVCKDSLVTAKDRKAVIELLNTNKYPVKRVDSLEIKQ